MATATVTLSAARKRVASHGVVWPDGPVCGPGEAKAWDMDLTDLLELVEIVEHAAPNTPTAAQWLRRMFYSIPLGGAGAGFDDLIRTDAARRAFPMTTRDVPQSVLDALVRVGSVRIPGAVAPFDKVEMSHVFVLLDLRLGGRSENGASFEAKTPGPTLADMLSWVGDVSSAWVGYQGLQDAAKKAAGPAWTEPVATDADLATPRGWLATGVRDRAAIDDVLGDLDAVTIASRALPPSPTPITTVLRDYYTVGVPSTGDIARVDDRFQQWVTRTNVAIPFLPGPPITLGPTAGEWVRAMVTWGAILLLAKARKQTAKFDFALALQGLELELNGPWHAAMLAELSARFHTFLADGLAGRTPAWPSGTTKSVPYPGYDWAPSSPATVGAPTLNDLEAVIQFHLNWPEPHRPQPTGSLFHTLRLHDPAGPAATVVPGAPAGRTRLRLEGFARLGEVTPSAAGEHADLLRLAGDTARPSRVYRIVAVDAAARTVDVDGVPALAKPSDWLVARRPRLVVVDPFAGRLSGSGASTQGQSAGWVGLDPGADLSRVRANFDILRLTADWIRPSRAYRVLEVHPTEPRVRLDATPSSFLGSGWQIPGGIASEVNPLATTLTPTADGCDAYDGLLFLVYGDTVRDNPLPITSYTSTANVADPVLGSSITGNRRYAVRSLRSPDSSARNYEFAVTDVGATGDIVADAAFYGVGVTALRTPPLPLISDTAPRDTDGKTAIRIHIGNSTGAVSGSTGDLVAPSYPTLRARLVEIHQAEREALGLARDTDLDAVASALTQAASIALYDAGTVADDSWNGRLHAELLLARPDLRPTAI